MGKDDAIESSKKIKIKKGLLSLDKNNCLKISRSFQNGEYDNIRNYYKEAKDSGYLDKDKYGTYAEELNHILWIFLFANKKSRADLKVLNTSIDIFNQSANTVPKKEDPVLKYLNEKGYKTYLEFSNHFNDKYGIDIEEYKYAKNNGLKISNENIFNDEPVSENEPVFSSTQIDDIIVSILDEHKEEFLESEDYGYSLLKEEVRKKLIYPVYRQKYKLPILQVISSSKVVYEFNMLDDKKDTESLFEKIYNSEKQKKHDEQKKQNKAIKKYGTTLYSSAKLEILKAFESLGKIEKLNSIHALKKVSILYLYMQDNDDNLSLTNAMHLYNFHILLFECNNCKQTTCQNFDWKIERKYKSADIVRKSFLDRELRKQINIIISLLSLSPQ